MDQKVIGIVHLLMATAKIFSQSETVDMPHPAGHSHVGRVTANIESKRSRQEVINVCKRLDRTERWETCSPHPLHPQMLLAVSVSKLIMGFGAIPTYLSWGRPLTRLEHK